MQLTKTIAKYVIGIGLCIWLLSKVDLAATVDVLAQGDYSLYVVAFLCFGVSSLLEGVRLYTLVPDRRLAPANIVRVISISTFFNNFAASVVGDVYRTYEVERAIRSWPQALTVVFLDRLIGLGCLAALAAICTLIVEPVWMDLINPADLGAVQANLPWLIAGSITMGAIALFVAHRLRVLKKIWGWVVQAWSVLRGVTLPDWVVALAATISAQLILTGMIHILLIAFGQSVDFSATLFSMLIVFLAAFIPISVGSLGVREGLLAVLLPLFGATPEAAVAAALISRLMMYTYAAFGGIWFMLRRQEVTPPEPKNLEGSPNV